MHEYDFEGRTAIVTGGAKGIGTGETMARFGRIDAMIANAGIAGVIKPAWETALEDWDRLIRVDLTSVFYACKAAIPHMLVRVTDRYFDRIFLLNSTMRDCHHSRLEIMKLSLTPCARLMGISSAMSPSLRR